MNSSRLPGKVLMKVGKMLIIERIVKRLSECLSLDKIIVATSDQKSDDKIANWCLENNVSLFRGSLFDVLDRYYRAAQKFEADTIVRITGDCPLVDPNIVDEVVTNYKKGNFDAAGLHGEFPDGLDCQVFSMKAIELAWKNATSTTDREHVGSYIENTRPDYFNLGKVELYHNLGHHRWTIDEPRDLEFLTLLIEDLEREKEHFYTEDVLRHLELFPDLVKINSSIVRNEGYLLSLKSENKYG
mgnify:CR=1 FL=1